MSKEDSILNLAIDNVDKERYYKNAKLGLEGMSSADLSNRLLTTQEVCELLKISKGYLYWLTHQKKIPHIKMQGHLRFRVSAIDNWLREQEVRSGCTQERKEMVR